MVNIVVVIPTYNERENIGRLIVEIFKLGPGIEVLVVDDDSPDGTAAFIKGVISKNPRVHLLLRKEKKGRGFAGADGFKHALQMGADLIVEMDADFSHNPKFIPALVDGCKDADIVIGSRMVQGGMEKGRGALRRFITLLANQFIRIFLNIDVKDCTSGFRCFKRKVLESIDLDTLVSSGPSIVEEVLYRCNNRGFSFKEVPIVFEERIKGKSNLNFRKLLNTFWMIVKFRFC